MPHCRPHTRRPWRIPLPLVLALALAGLATSALAASTQDSFPDLPLDLEPASAKALGLSSGAGARLARIPAQGLIVVLVSYFCPPCHLEVPRLKELERRIRERALAGRIRMVGVAVGDDKAQVERFLARHEGLPFPLLPDPALDAHKRLNNPVVPTLYVVSKEGGALRLLTQHRGQFVEDPDLFLDRVLGLLPSNRKSAPSTRAIK